MIRDGEFFKFFDNDIERLSIFIYIVLFDRTIFIMKKKLCGLKK